MSASVNAGTAAMTVLTGQVDAGTGPSTGTLVGGKYVSTSRFLEVECGMSKQTASATVARARDLRGDYAVMERPWLEGELSSDAVREITVGVKTAIKHSGLPYEERELARKAALETLIPLGEVGTVEDVRRAISHLKLMTDPDGATQAAMDAFDDQSLTVEQIGSMSKLTAWLTHENAAALMTVLTQRVDGMRRAGELAEEDQLAPEIDPETFTGRRIASEKHQHLLAVAFGDMVTGLLDDNAVGSHHGIAPHVTVAVDLARFEAGLGADLTMPGTDMPVLLANETVRRILCDCDIATVITRPPVLTDPATCDQSLAHLLLEAARDVLYVGRARTRRRPTAASRARGTRPALRLPRLSRSRAPLQRPPRPRVGARRPHRPRQPGAAVRSAPPRSARGRMDDRASGRLSGRQQGVGLRAARTTTAALTSRAHHPSPACHVRRGSRKRDAT